VAAIAACALAACGSSSQSATDSPSAAAKTYLNSLANGNGAGACSVLSPAIQTRELAAARSQGVKTSDCASLFSQVKAHLTSRQRKLLLDAKVVSAKQSGNTATVTLKGARRPLTLQKVGGKWLITAGVGV
jgi:outer membrane PBP1 activator LpoA protein